MEIHVKNPRDFAALSVGMDNGFGEFSLVIAIGDKELRIFAPSSEMRESVARKLRNELIMLVGSE